MQTLRRYTNECLKKVSKYYNSKEYYINEKFEDICIELKQAYSSLLFTLFFNKIFFKNN
jgi:hypothetical protein